MFFNFLLEKIKCVLFLKIIITYVDKTHVAVYKLCKYWKKIIKSWDLHIFKKFATNNYKTFLYFLEEEKYKFWIGHKTARLQYSFTHMMKEIWKNMENWITKQFCPRISWESLRWVDLMTTTKNLDFRYKSIKTEYKGEVKCHKKKDLQKQKWQIVANRFIDN